MSILLRHTVAPLASCKQVPAILPNYPWWKREWNPRKTEPEWWKWCSVCKQPRCMNCQYCRYRPDIFDPENGYFKNREHFF